MVTRLARKPATRGAMRRAPMGIPAPARGIAGMLFAEMAVAMGILAAVLIPLAFIFHQELKLCRAHYYEAVALELVDGEMEVLAAGEWRACGEGEQRYAPTAMAVTNLPPGAFVVSHTGAVVRLEWRPAQPGKGRSIVREWRHP